MTSQESNNDDKFLDDDNMENKGDDEFMNNDVSDVKIKRKLSKKIKENSKSKHEMEIDNIFDSVLHGSSKISKLYSIISKDDYECDKYSKKIIRELVISLNAVLRNNNKVNRINDAFEIIEHYQDYSLFKLIVVKIINNHIYGNIIKFESLHLFVKMLKHFSYIHLELFKYHDIFKKLFLFSGEITHELINISTFENHINHLYSLPSNDYTRTNCFNEYILTEMTMENIYDSIKVIDKYCEDIDNSRLFYMVLTLICEKITIKNDKKIIEYIYKWKFNEPLTLIDYRDFSIIEELIEPTADDIKTYIYEFAKRGKTLQSSKMFLYFGKILYIKDKHQYYKLVASNNLQPIINDEEDIEILFENVSKNKYCEYIINFNSVDLIINESIRMIKHEYYNIYLILHKCEWFCRNTIRKSDFMKILESRTDHDSIHLYSVLMLLKCCVLSVNYADEIIKLENLIETERLYYNRNVMNILLAKINSSDKSISTQYHNNLKIVITNLENSKFNVNPFLLSTFIFKYQIKINPKNNIDLTDRLYLTQNDFVKYCSHDHINELLLLCTKYYDNKIFYIKYPPDFEELCDVIQKNDLITLFDICMYVYSGPKRQQHDYNKIFELLVKKTPHYEFYIKYVMKSLIDIELL
jgi:hypothetical protein